MSKIALRIICLLIGLMPGLAMSQITFDGCADFRGIPVASIANVSVPDVAMATYTPNGAPIIIYNPYILSWLSPQTRLFFYAHECAHHVLAHGVRGIPFTREQEADCWGVQQLVTMGFLSDDVSVVQQDLARAGQGDWTHLPGPPRAVNLRFCLAGMSFDKSSGTEEASDNCARTCEATEERCASRYTRRLTEEACYDRCQERFDACTNRCP